MNRQWLAIGLVLTCMIILGGNLGVAAQEPSGELSATLLLSGLEGGSGSTIGPDGALYVAENAVGKISRVDPDTGDITEFASGLPERVDATIGGIMDIAFVDETVYA